MSEIGKEGDHNEDHLGPGPQPGDGRPSARVGLGGRHGSVPRLGDERHPADDRQLRRRYRPNRHQRSSQRRCWSCHPTANIHTRF